MYSRIYRILVSMILVGFILGCSNGSVTNPVICDSDSPEITGHNIGSISGNSRMMWGLYEIAIDTETLQAEIVPLRGVQFNANVTMFMQPPISPTNRIHVSIDTGASDLVNGLFAIDITLLHPFPGLGQYSGFDVRGIFMSDGSILSDHYSGLTYAADDESHLLNPDGWTRWWNPTEFTTYGSVFGYTEGAFSSPGFSASATLNPYKYFADGIESEDELSIDPATRGFFSIIPGSNTRRYMIQFEMDAGSPVVLFNYAVDAGWEEPTGEGPEYNADDYPLSANCQEAYQLSVADAGSTAWWVSDTENGGDLIFDITVYDWQSVANPVGVPGEVAAIWVESSDLLTAPVDVYPTATPLPDGPTSSVFHVEIMDVSPSGLTGQTLLFGIESSDPADYAPQIDGITGFEYPEEPLTAFMFWDAPILGEEPVTIPTPLGFDNCAAAGVVKLFWDPVTWPTLAGYNLYKKLSTEPSFDFENPLNTEVITGTEYVDDDVLMDGTTYDYVVTAVDSDTTESVPSNQTSATPDYSPPTGFTDLDNPDGTMGSGGIANIINATITADGTIYLVWDVAGGSGPHFVRGNLSDGSYGATVSLGSCFPTLDYEPDVAVDSQGMAHIVFTDWWNVALRKYYYATVDSDDVVGNAELLHEFTATGSRRVEPTVTVTPDDEVHIVMPSNDGSPCLRYMHGTPGNFSSPEVITYVVQSSERDMEPDLGSDRYGNLHLVWVGPSSNAIHYMSRNTDGDWSSPVSISPGLGVADSFAKIAVDYLGVVHVAWKCQYWSPPSWVHTASYANNRSGSFQGQHITGAGSVNYVGVACDRDGNAYVDCYSGSRVYVALIDRDDNIVEVAPVNDDLPYQGSWPTMAGNIDPCWSSDASVIAFWKEYPWSPPPLFGRIQTDY